MLDPLYFGHMLEEGVSVVVDTPVLVEEEAADETSYCSQIR